MKPYFTFKYQINFPSDYLFLPNALLTYQTICGIITRYTNANNILDIKTKFYF